MLKQEHKTIIPARLQQNVLQGTLPQRLLYCFCIGLTITLFFTCIEIFFIVLLNPFFILGSSNSNRFFSLWALPFHTPLVLLVPFIELLITSGAIALIAKPLALVAYLKAVHAAQEEYHTLYTPLATLFATAKKHEKNQDIVLDSNASDQEVVISMLELVQHQSAHQIIIGVPGAGKTIVLRVYQYLVSQQPFYLSFSHSKIPVYVPLKNYSLFLKKRQIGSSEDDAALQIAQARLFDYLYESDLPGMHYLRHVLRQLSEQGRLILLCDGLNEVDSNYRTQVTDELVYLMQATQNRLLITSRGVDFREQNDLVRLVDEGQAAKIVIHSLQAEQISEFIEHYIQKQDHHWIHTAGQIMQLIERSRLQYYCSNPMLLSVLMKIIDKIGIERGKQIDTRGLLLREYGKQLIEWEQRQTRWHTNAPDEREVVRLLSQIACAARWTNDSNALQLHVPSQALALVNQAYTALSFEEIADGLLLWLDEHPVKGPFVLEQALESEPFVDIAQLLEFAVRASLIEVSPAGVLSFQHEFIAEYLVAEYFAAASPQEMTQPLRKELLEHVGRWSEPVAIWAGLLKDPLDLAELFGVAGLSNRDSLLPALILGLVCVGVLWAPPQAERHQTILLPPELEEALALVVRDRVAREELASLFLHCAEEGAQEIYRSILSLIMVDGIDDWLILLDQAQLPELFFTYLQETVDTVEYDAQVKRLIRILGRFGAVVVDRATQLSLPAAERSPRLRSAVINILGGTHDSHAVEPLIARLRDMDAYIIGRATNGLIRLGPTLVLTRILQELEDHSSGQLMLSVHRATLKILERFMDEQDPMRQLSLAQHQRILETVVPVLTSNYQNEPETQLLARELLIRQARNNSGVGSRDNRWEKVIEAILRYLPSQNELAVQNVELVLQEIGTPATAHLVALLSNPSEFVRLRVIAILNIVRDPAAIPALLRLLGDASSTVQQQLALALMSYAPESIVGLIDLVLYAPNEKIADRAAHILASMGTLVVLPIIDVLPEVVPERTRLLVQVLEVVHDPQSVPALISLLVMAQNEPLLAITIVRALSQFPEKRVVASLLSTVAAANPQLYEESINALSQLGNVALDGLIEALNREQDTVLTQRIRRAILGIVPFPAEQLIVALESCSEAQTAQISAILKLQGSDAAFVLVKHLLHPNKKVKVVVESTLDQMQGAVVVPALLKNLTQQPLRNVISPLLLKYPEAAMMPLVDLLGEQERGSVVATILPQFGSIILRPLLAGLDDQRSMARELASRIMITLVRQSQEEQRVLRDILGLFNPSPPIRARETLIGILTNELADLSLPVLLDALADSSLLHDAAACLVRLVLKSPSQNGVLHALLQALYSEERRRGAEIALINLRELAVLSVGELITDPLPAVSGSAQMILCEIGVPALSFIWTAQSDKQNPARRKAAIDIFHRMPTAVIKDELVSLLVNQRRDDTAMAVALLLERIHEESVKSYADRVMVPELLNYIQTHSSEGTNLRIIALLLLLGEQTISLHLIEALDDPTSHNRQLTYTLLLLGKKTYEALLSRFHHPETTSDFRLDIATILGMVMPADVVTHYASHLSTYGMPTNQMGALFPEELSIALRALGGLLASGHWSAPKLQELRDQYASDSDIREVFNVLLGYRYEPQIAQLQNELDFLRETYKKEVVTWAAKLLTEQKRSKGLEEELEKIRQEHGSRGDDLQKALRDQDALRTNLEQVEREKAKLLTDIALLNREKTTLNSRLTQMAREKANIGELLERSKLEYQALQRRVAQIMQASNNTQTK